ncbi:MAG TPA: GTPase [Gemmatimonadales bacterium]|nr:GTPase [Gemmatimonadales bacterium]
MRHHRPPAPAGHRAPAPEERSLTDPRFVGSFPRADVTLDPPHPEVAFLGRSNVGKSSLLNALVGRTVARISATPGKTRLLNVFEIELGSREPGAVRSLAERSSALPESERLPAAGAVYFLDLPGYGYARVSQTDRRAFRTLVEGTLVRVGLVGVIWLLDIRHDLSKQDREIRDLLSGTGVRTLAALTKGDKLPRGAGRKREAELAAELELDDDQVLVTSAKTGTGIPDLREALSGLIGKAEG